MATNNGPQKPAANTATKPREREGYTVALQTERLQRNKGKAITVRLMDGTRLAGVLEGWDQYTIALRITGREEQVLVNKHGIALFRRVEAADQEKAT